MTVYKWFDFSMQQQQQKKKREGIHKMSHEIIGIMDKQQKNIGLATY